MRPLPTGENFKKELAPMTVFVAPVIIGISKTCEVMKTDPLSTKEMESGEMAFAAMLYQYGTKLDAKVLLALWIASVTGPRLIQFMDKKLDERKKKDGNSNPNPDK